MSVSADGRSCTSSMPGAGDRRGRHAEGLFEQSADAVGERFGGVRVTPGVPRHRRKQAVGCIVVDHALQYYICCQSVTTSRRTIGDRILAAAASCVRDFGVERVTLAEIARRAGVSRPTVYRRWPDTRSILAGAAHRSGHRRVAGYPGSAAGPRRPGRPDRGGREAAAQRRADRLGAALGARPGDGLHLRTAGHQPADPDRPGCRRTARRPGRRQRPGRRRAADVRRWSC